MKYHLIVLLAFVVAASCQENHGCKTGCECPDFLSLFISRENEEYFYEKHDGCSFNLTCPEGGNGLLQCLFSESEIPELSNSYNGLFVLLASEYEGTRVPTYNIYSTFGLICEKGSWYATKYPIGIQYFTTTATIAIMGSAEEYAGKKSRVDQAECSYSL